MKKTQTYSYSLAEANDILGYEMDSVENLDLHDCKRLTHDDYYDTLTVTINKNTETVEISASYSE